MCGIAGIIDQNIENKDKVILDMVNNIIHRGPDDDGFYVDKHVGIGMRRLSIIDLSEGQPENILSLIFPVSVQISTIPMLSGFSYPLLKYLSLTLSKKS